MNKHYTAVTIGPIIETLNTARKTRELWGASYLFSYIIRQIVLKLHRDDVLLPYFKDDMEWQNHYGAGLFPDKIYLKGKHDVTLVYNDVLSKLAHDIELWFSNKSIMTRKLKATSDILPYLQNYFRFIEIHFECNADENIINKGTTLLDSKELQTKIIPEDEFVSEENPLFYFLYHINGSFLFKDGFVDFHPSGAEASRRFPSLIEIAMHEFKVINEVKYAELEAWVEIEHEKFSDLSHEKNQGKTEDNLIDQAELLFQDKIKPAHKYIAIIQADGDKIGSMVAKVGTDPIKIQKFSQKLMEYSKKSTDISVSYGGSPVYMGGDDLFFFAPLIYNVNNTSTSFFDMIKALDDAFIDIVSNYAKNELELKVKDLPSLSFGISLSYYKFPLYEAKKMAFSALFEDIKWVDKRNAIKLKFRKHSGQLIELFIDKNSNILWNETLNFINQNLSIDAKFLNSFTHKLRLQDEVLFSVIACDKLKLEAFFQNNYNENYKANEYFYLSIQKIIPLIRISLTKIDEMKKYLYSILRFVHFLRS